MDPIEIMSSKIIYITYVLLLVYPILVFGNNTTLPFFTEPFEASRNACYNKFSCETKYKSIFFFLIGTKMSLLLGGESLWE